MAVKPCLGHVAGGGGKGWGHGERHNWWLRWGGPIVGGKVASHHRWGAMWPSWAVRMAATTGEWDAGDEQPRGGMQCQRLVVYRAVGRCRGGFSRLSAVARPPQGS